MELTSAPTGRAAYAETRQWLLARHGPVCAYCENRVAAGEITLDHVTPRRGQTAYDRRDNLVLCCKPCNGSKMDKPILAFLLGRRSRVVALYKYGRHLSHQLVEMVNDLLPVDQRPPLGPPPVKHPPRRRQSAHEILGDLGDESPYGEPGDEISPYAEVIVTGPAVISASPDAAAPSAPAGEPKGKPKHRPIAKVVARPAKKPVAKKPVATKPAKKSMAKPAKNRPVAKPAKKKPVATPPKKPAGKRTANRKPAKPAPRRSR